MQQATNYLFIWHMTVITIHTIRWLWKKEHLSCIMYLCLLGGQAPSLRADWRTVLISNQVDGWGKILSFSSVLPESQGILSSFAFIDFLSVALIKIAVLHCNLLAWNEVGINQPPVKYSNFIIVQKWLWIWVSFHHVADTMFQSLWKIQWHVNFKLKTGFMSYTRVL